MAEHYKDVKARGRSILERGRTRTSSINFVNDFTGGDPFGITFEDDQQIERRYTVLSTAMRSRAQTIRSRLNTVSSIVDGKEVEIIEEPKTNWKSLWIVTFVSMFNGMQFSVFFASLWPFLHTVDSGASSIFFGIITSAYCFMQAIFGPFYGMWMNKSGSTRYPLAAGIAIMAVANALYAFTEMFPEHTRRYIMLIARCGVGIGSGCLGVTRAYAATASTLKDRARAITYMSASFVIGLTIGPGLQVAFTPVKDGFYIGTFHFSEYTAPALFAVLIDCASLVILFTCFNEDYAGLVIVETKSDPYFVLPMYKKIPAFVCIISQFTVMFVVTNGEAIGSMYTMAMFDWTDEEATEYNGILQAVGGVASLVMYIIFALKVGNWVSQGRERMAIIISFISILLYHVITYPFPFLPNKVDFNKTVDGETVGCLKDYGWCGYTKQVNLWVYVIANIFCMSIAFPVNTISTSTLYSKVLGNRQQGTMQSLQFMAGSIARTIGPLLMTTLFDKWGPEVIWAVEILVIGITILLWIIFYRTLVPLDIKPILKPGEYYKYEKGYKYRF